MEGACVATAAERELARRSYILSRLIEENRALGRHERRVKKDPALPEKIPPSLEPKTSTSTICQSTRRPASGHEEEVEEDLKHLQSLRDEVHLIAKKEQGNPTNKIKAPFKNEKNPSGSAHHNRLAVYQETLYSKGASRNDANSKPAKAATVSEVASGTANVVPLAIVEVNLAAVAAALKVRVKAADMPALLQERAFRCARQSLDVMDKLNSKRVALALKKEFDTSYGPAWHCIVGTSFGSFVTHSLGGFLYFSMDKVSILLFKTAVEPLDQ
jgi:dynein light chain LC8-type